MEKGEPLEARDVIIAATAITRNAMLLTINKKTLSKVNEIRTKISLKNYEKLN